jgi:hypothetical protein
MLAAAKTQYLRRFSASSGSGGLLDVANSSLLYCIHFAEEYSF